MKSSPCRFRGDHLAYSAAVGVPVVERIIEGSRERRDFFNSGRLLDHPGMQAGEQRHSVLAGGCASRSSAERPRMAAVRFRIIARCASRASLASGDCRGPHKDRRTCGARARLSCWQDKRASIAESGFIRSRRTMSLHWRPKTRSRLTG